MNCKDGCKTTGLKQSPAHVRTRNRPVFSHFLSRCQTFLLNKSFPCCFKLHRSGQHIDSAAKETWLCAALVKLESLKKHTSVYIYIYWRSTCCSHPDGASFSAINDTRKLLFFFFLHTQATSSNSWLLMIMEGMINELPSVGNTVASSRLFVRQYLALKTM